MPDIFASKSTNRRKKIYLFILLVVILGLFIFLTPIVSNSSFVQRIFNKSDVIYKSKILKIGDQKLGVYIADTEEKRIKGLSGFDYLPTNSGMFFIFDRLSDHHIWMKDMKIPIDIFWIDEKFFIIHIEKDISPETFPNKFAPYSPSLYVLETNSGFAERNKIKVGDRVDLKID